MFFNNLASTFLNTFSYGHGHGQGRKTLKTYFAIWQILDDT